MNHHLLTSFVYASREGSDETAQMSRLIRAFSAHLCHNTKISCAGSVQNVSNRVEATFERTKPETHHREDMANVRSINDYDAENSRLKKKKTFYMTRPIL